MDENILKAAKIYFSYVIEHQIDTLTEDSLKSVQKIINSGFEKTAIEDIVLFSDYKRNPKKRIEGAIVVYEGKAYILFMATNSKLDWVTNLIFFKKTIPYNNVRNRKIKVHSGYMKRYTLNSVRTSILLWLAEHKEIKEVVVAGYSMGGGLSPICAVDVAYNFPDKKVYCYAFAGPRVGNEAFIKSVEKRVEAIHFSYGNDIVTKVPPKCFGFRHLTNQVHYGPEKKWWKLSIKEHYPHNLLLPLLED